jgi:hypothetical protein
MSWVPARDAAMQRHAMLCWTGRSGTIPRAAANHAPGRTTARPPLVSTAPATRPGRPPVREPGGPLGAARPPGPALQARRPGGPLKRIRRNDERPTRRPARPPSIPAPPRAFKGSHAEFTTRCCTRTSPRRKPCAGKPIRLAQQPRRGFLASSGTPPAGRTDGKAARTRGGRLPASSLTRRREIAQLYAQMESTGTSPGVPGDRVAQVALRTSPAGRSSHRLATRFAQRLAPP